MGFTVVSYTLKDVHDSAVNHDGIYINSTDPNRIRARITQQGYMEALGMTRTAEVKRDARIGEAEAKADAQIKQAIAEEQRMASRLANDIEIAKAQRDFELKKASYDQEVNAKVTEPKF